jgi:site-specific DNA-methyltransferase (adenine-specific)
VSEYIDKMICGDFLEVAKGLPEKSMPLIIADPPYNIGKAAWDKIPDYLDWCGKWLEAVERVMADNGSLYIFHNDKEVMADLMLWIRENTGFVFKNEIVWGKIKSDFRNYGFAQQRLSNGTMRNYYDGFTEYILFYTFQDETGLSRVYDDRDCFRGIKEYLRGERKKANAAGYDDKGLRRVCGVSLKGGGLMCHFWGDAQWMLPTAEMYARLQTTGFFQKPYEELRMEYEELRMEYEELRYTFNLTRVVGDVYGNSNTWLYEPVSKPEHPTQKPVDLIENIIRHSSNEGDLILDPFSGSGTTAVAAIKNNRHYLCVDMEREYCDIAERRIVETYQEIENEARQLALFAAGG